MSGQSHWNPVTEPDKAERPDMSGQSLCDLVRRPDMCGLTRVFGGRIVRDFPEEVSSSSFHFCCQDENRILLDRIRSNLI
jgi:hypothetical protein